MYKQTQKRKNENRLSFYRFWFFERTNIKKRKNKIGFRFTVFRFKYEKHKKTEKGKSTSVLSFFVLCTKKQKTEKRKLTSVLWFFVF